MSKPPKEYIPGCSCPFCLAWEEEHGTPEFYQCEQCGQAYGNCFGPYQHDEDEWEDMT